MDHHHWFDDGQGPAHSLSDARYTNTVGDARISPDVRRTVIVRVPTGNHDPDVIYVSEWLVLSLAPVRWTLITQPLVLLLLVGPLTPPGVSVVAGLFGPGPSHGDLRLRAGRL